MLNHERAEFKVLLRRGKRVSERESEEKKEKEGKKREKRGKKRQ